MRALAARISTGVRDRGRGKLSLMLHHRFLRPLTVWILATIMARVAMRVLTCLALVCVRRAAAGRTCGEHQTIYEKASPVHKSNVAACLRWSWIMVLTPSATRCHYPTFCGVPVRSRTAPKIMWPQRLPQQRQMAFWSRTVSAHHVIVRAPDFAEIGCTGPCGRALVMGGRAL